MAARASGAVLAQRPKTLYRYLLRIAEALPEDARKHYKHRIRQEFTSYADETDPERVREIVAMAMKDAEWVLQKHQKT